MLPLHKAILVKRTTEDGVDFIEDDVPLGKEYWVDLDSLGPLEWGCLDRPGKKIHPRQYSNLRWSTGKSVRRLDANGTFES